MIKSPYVVNMVVVSLELRLQTHDSRQSCDRKTRTPNDGGKSEGGEQRSSGQMWAENIFRVKPKTR